MSLGLSWVVGVGSVALPARSVAPPSCRPVPAAVAGVSAGNAASATAAGLLSPSRIENASAPCGNVRTVGDPGNEDTGGT